MSNNIISKEISNLRELRDVHIELGKLILSAHGGDLYTFDLLAVATLNRSMGLLRGFCDLMESSNFIAAAPIVRLQLDNLLRFSAGWIVEDPHEFAFQVLEGKHVRNLVDIHKKKMTDRYLVELMSEKEPRFLNLYNETSGYIHLSNKHMFNAIGESDNNEKLTMKISDQDEFIPKSLYIEAINAFQEVTSTLFEYAYGWAYTKDNPTITNRDNRP